MTSTPAAAEIAALSDPRWLSKQTHASLIGVITMNIPNLTVPRFKSYLAAAFAVLVTACLNSDALCQAGNSPSDEDISDAVELQLVLDERIDGHRIDAKTKSGVVTLSGAVDNLLASEYALHVAGRTRGVRSVVNLVEVNAPEIADEKLRKDLAQALKDDPATERFEVVAKVTAGVVTLEGEVQSHAERQSADFAVAGVRGVRKVVNDLKVKPARNRSDEEIKEDIARRFSMSAWIEDYLVDVTVRDGHVTLSGSVPSLADHLRARTAAWVQGVHSVTFRDLDVVGYLPNANRKTRRVVDVKDEAIVEAVKDAINTDPRIGPNDIVPKSEDHTVRLRGTVSHYAAKRAAEEDTWNTFGVTNVFNLIKVRLPKFPSDDEIKEQITRMLSVDPFVNRLDIHVTVRNSTPYLHGSVDSAFERLRAEEVASKARGVVFVENRLDVDSSDLKSDEEILSTITERMKWDTRLDGNKIDFEVGDATATITGEVRNQQLRNALKSIAHEAGAIKVRDRLTVE